jgi:hypothetical protein
MYVIHTYILYYITGLEPNQTLRIRYRKFDLDFVYNFPITYPESLVMILNRG